MTRIVYHCGPWSAPGTKMPRPPRGILPRSSPRRYPLRARPYPSIPPTPIPSPIPTVPADRAREAGHQKRRLPACQGRLFISKSVCTESATHLPLITIDIREGEGEGEARPEPLESGSPFRPSDSCILSSFLRSAHLACIYLIPISISTSTNKQHLIGISIVASKMKLVVLPCFQAH